MKRVFDFVESLKPEFIELIGYPTVHFFKDSIRVFFNTSKCVHNLSVLSFLEDSCDEFLLYAGCNVVDDCGQLTIVCTFYNLPFEQ